jgi:hypothetical protein
LQPKSDFTYNSSITMSLELPRFRLKDIGQIFAIKKRRISLGNTPNGRMLYEWFTQPHDKLPIVSNKTLGVELLDLQMFDDFEHYLKCINGKNSAAYYRRKALSKGYTFTDIDRNQYINDIYEINSSRETRQGRQMHPAYFEKPTQYIDEHNWLYCGVLNSSGKLVAYLNLQIANEVAVVRTLLGHGDFLNDGIMYLLLVEAARRIYELGGYLQTVLGTVANSARNRENRREQSAIGPTGRYLTLALHEIASASICCSSSARYSDTISTI